MDNKTVIDLGCGNGVLGIYILNQNKQTKVVFVDESYMAVASAKQNVLVNVAEKEHQSDFIVNNCLDDFTKKSKFSNFSSHYFNFQINY